MCFNMLAHPSFIEFEKAYYSVGREIFYSILIEFDVPMTLVTVLEVCLSSSWVNVCLMHFLFTMV
jgi:hypothetical protein